MECVTDNYWRLLEHEYVIDITKNLNKMTKSTTIDVIENVREACVQGMTLNRWHRLLIIIIVYTGYSIQLQVNDTFNCFHLRHWHNQRSLCDSEPSVVNPSACPSVCHFFKSYRPRQYQSDRYDIWFVCAQQYWPKMFGIIVLYFLLHSLWSISNCQKYLTTGFFLEVFGHFQKRSLMRDNETLFTSIL